MAKIAAIGSREQIAGFAALGIRIFPTGGTSVEKLIHQLADNEYAVIYITEEAAEEAQDVIEKYRAMALPAILLLPGAQNRGMQLLHDYTEKAVGSDILK